MGETPEHFPSDPIKPTLNPHRCDSCGAGLREDQSTCVYCGTRCIKISAPVFSALPPAAPEIPTTVPSDALCRGCGYALIGLQVSDVCPECGRPVLDSIRGDLLQYCDPKYLQTLHRGIVLVQSSLIMYVLVSVLGIGLGALVFARIGFNFQALSSLLGLIPAAVSFIGWLIISIPDPGVSIEDKGDKPRKTLRIAAVVNTAAAMLAGVLGAISPAVSTFAPGSGASTLNAGIIFQALVRLATAASFIAFVVQFFAAMKYLHWIAPRIPNHELASKMKKQTWTIALLYFPGCILFGIGPLISLVLFYNLLDKFRVDFKRVRLENTFTSELWKELASMNTNTGYSPKTPAQPPNSGGTI